MSSPITTHVLDLATGIPAAGIAVDLECQNGDSTWHKLSHGHTDQDGRLRSLLKEGGLKLGVYRLVFHADSYFAAQNCESFYRRIPIEFVVAKLAQHYHVPLLLSPFGYSTYRGS